jgi:hypothetical protein
LTVAARRRVYGAHEVARTTRVAFHDIRRDAYASIDAASRDDRRPPG